MWTKHLNPLSANFTKTLFECVYHFVGLALKELITFVNFATKWDNDGYKDTLYFIKLPATL